MTQVTRTAAMFCTGADELLFDFSNCRIMKIFIDGAMIYARGAGAHRTRM